jgi:hypothetical protein
LGTDETAQHALCSLSSAKERTPRAIVHGPVQETRRLRISRFERDGRSLEHLAETIAGKFGIDPSALRIRHRGTKGSDARKGFAYAAAKEYHTPLGIIAAYLDVGRTAVSAMCREGKEILKRYKINI